MFMVVDKNIVADRRYFSELRAEDRPRRGLSRYGARLTSSGGKPVDNFHDLIEVPIKLKFLQYMMAGRTADLFV
jgi:hypothetical protein